MVIAGTHGNFGDELIAIVLGLVFLWGIAPLYQLAATVTQVVVHLKPIIPNLVRWLIVLACISAAVGVAAVVFRVVFYNESAEDRWLLDITALVHGILAVGNVASTAVYVYRVHRHGRSEL